MVKDTVRRPGLQIVSGNRDSIFFRKDLAFVIHHYLFPDPQHA
jgi:hypothetical protein